MFDLDSTTSQGSALAPLRIIEEKPAISVVGLGYVGAVSTACLSSLGHKVIGVDLDADKIAAIGAGRSPIHEKDLDGLLFDGVANGLVSATDDLEQAVIDSDVTFVSVGTPTAADGGCDHSFIAAAARSIGRGLKQKSDFHIVVMRCSIPPGVTMGFMAPIIEEVSGLRAGVDFGVCFNPEFLREGVAVEDFYAPPKTVIGASDDRSANTLRRIYEAVDPAPIVTPIETAEMVKYVDNVWHATKVCFANEVGRLCKPLGVDSHDVMDVFVQDTKLNLSPYYLKPGFAYGGSCLPKEVRAVAHIAKEQGVHLPMIESLDVSNKTHIDAALEMVRKTGARKVGVLGLAFKQGTDDLRESPILEVIAALHDEGVKVTIHDTAITVDTPLAGQLAYVRNGSPGLQKMAHALPHMLRSDLSEVVDTAQALIVTHKNDLYADAIRTATDVPVIDVVRAVSNDVEHANINGIGW
ncbi:nucleotide sugar dehydrogenase [Sulfitobacter mediterraneus]|uniref:nucleotide sugar dehydrogenase n=1 Tax=Sulfitobacter mediterraneus TaxID=83219 RepID=UPI000EA3B6C2|nr:nucleotide sugar dehydrogenase [Sulfitobacter mediterraneus]UWR11547.1 nucleotide sugar dehydrogenase [Sulfitobacter mediterraneus]